MEESHLFRKLYERLYAMRGSGERPLKLNELAFHMEAVIEEYDEEQEKLREEQNIGGE